MSFSIGSSTANSTYAIQVRELGKRYLIGSNYTKEADTLAGSFLRGWRRKPLFRSAQEQEFWALRDVSFDIPKGEVVGIIGSNGAGKSTLLKILTQITPPTFGRAAIHGNVGSLLEVGTGFHRELTGRENIFLNGAILGMKKSDIVAKLDEIIEFAEIEEFINTPVKHYSSGMYVRLAFAVAAHLDADVLLVDEVLAVGDAGFQKKCLGKMNEVANTGRTVIFVSHTMSTIASLCSRTILMDAGRIAMDGPTQEVIDQYIEQFRQGDSTRSEIRYPEIPSLPAQITSVRILDSKGDVSLRHHLLDPIQIEVNYEIRKSFRNLMVACSLFTYEGTCVFTSNDMDWQNYSDENKIDESPKSPGQYQATTTITTPLLNEGIYEVCASLTTPRLGPTDTQGGVYFEVFDTESFVSYPFKSARRGVVATPLKWNIEQL